MAECYLLALCTSSALDGVTNNWSLYNLIEQVQVEGVPAVLPWELHVFLKYGEGEVGAEFELRVVFSSGSGEVTSNPVRFRSVSARHRLKLTPIPVPQYGAQKIQFDLRKVGADQWERNPAFWPLIVEPLQGETALLPS
jgi:hypothetical protein